MKNTLIRVLLTVLSVTAIPCYVMHAFIMVAKEMYCDLKYVWEEDWW